MKQILKTLLVTSLSVVSLGASSGCGIKASFSSQPPTITQPILSGDPSTGIVPTGTAPVAPGGFTPPGGGIVTPPVLCGDSPCPTYPTYTPSPSPSSTSTPNPVTTPTPNPTTSPNPVTSPTPTPTPTPVTSPTPTSTPTPVTSPTPNPSGTPTPHPTCSCSPHPTPTPTPTPRPTCSPHPTPTPTPTPTCTHTPHPTPTPTPTYTPTPVPSCNPLKIPTFNFCSNDQTNAHGGTNISTASGIYFKIYQVNQVSTLGSGGSSGSNITLSEVAIQESSEDPVAIRASLLQHALVIPANIIAGLPSGTFTAIICPSSGLGLADPNCSLSIKGSLPVSGGNYPSLIDVTQVNIGSDVLGPVNHSVDSNRDSYLATFTKAASGAVNLNFGSGSKYPGLFLDVTFNANYGSAETLNGEDISACNEDVSPLLINTIPNTSVKLSSQATGVKFDITGNGVPFQISWPKHPEKDMFLALPDQYGHVNGIQQLFGNNTIGPDGKTAVNGFEALRKYAKPNATQIDSSDAVYSKLRLWSDVNRDGVAQSSELHSLSEMGISAISLGDSQVFEVDAYGNQTRERSYVKTQAGWSLFIFDIWFALGLDN